MKDKSKRDEDGYTVIFFLITFIFLYASFFLLIATKTEWKDVFAGACSIAGGIVGGIITLQGVKRTIEAQREITLEGVKATIEAQKEQEMLKSIPKKLVSLHNLSTKIEEFKGEIDKKTQMFSYSYLDEVGRLQDIKDSKDEMKIKVSELIKFIEDLNSEQYEFIEIVSNINIDIYKEVKILFKRLKSESEWLLASNEFRKYNINVSLAEDIDKKTFIENTDPLIYKLREFSGKIHSQFKNLEEITIPKELEDYEKQMH